MANELDKIAKRTTMDSREIAKLTGKRHDNILRDIEDQLKAVGGLLNFEDTYQNEQNGQTYKCYKLPYRETMILISGYSVELRAAIVDRWLELERKNVSERKKSIDARNSFTYELKDHGCNAPIHYIKITATMKKNAGIKGNKKKEEFDTDELIAITAAESLASLMLSKSKAEGYDQCKPICQSAASAVLEIVNRDPQRRIEE